MEEIKSRLEHIQKYCHSTPTPVSPCTYTKPSGCQLAVASSQDESELIEMAQQKVSTSKW